MNLEEYRKEVLKVDKPRKTTIRNSYGVYDAYKFYRKNKPKDPQYVLTESQYFSIVRQTNLLLAQDLLHQKDIVFPFSMGRLEIRKYTPNVSLKNGKVKSTYPIDWDGTIRLWYEDEEARNKKLILKKKEKEVFKIGYNKSKAMYKNKKYFEFIVNRGLKRALKDIISQGNFEAFNSR